jgi:hypothetical protein
LVTRVGEGKGEGIGNKRTRMGEVKDKGIGDKRTREGQDGLVHKRNALRESGTGRGKREGKEERGRKEGRRNNILNCISQQYWAERTEVEHKKS